ncbi:F-box/kelch-repeat protein [Tanacetum coccineum]
MGKVYVAGGSTRTSAVEEYDPKRNLWRVVSHAPRMRYGCIGAAMDGVLYVIGGLKIGGVCNDAPSRAAAGSGVHVYASSMDLYNVEARRWLRSRSIPGGGSVVAALIARTCWFWRSGVGFKESPAPNPSRLDGTVRVFSLCWVGKKVVLIQVMGCIDDLLRRSGRSSRGVKDALVLVYDSDDGEWSRGADLPDVVRRAACVCVESIPGGGCVVAACSCRDSIYILASHAVELSFWKFHGNRRVGFGEWCRLKSPPLPTQVRLDGTVRSGRSSRGVKDALVLVYDSDDGEWSRGADLPDVVRRAACVCVEWHLMLADFNIRLQVLECLTSEADYTQRMLVMKWKCCITTSRSG